MQNLESQKINKRFFDAMDRLMETEQVPNLYRFCTDYEINRRNLLRLRDEPQREFQMSFLTILVEKFDISAHWLLTGKGDMFLKKKAKN